MDYADQEWFANVVIKIETELDPFRLLKRLKDIECDVGRRDQDIRFGPRILDMDIVLFDDMVIDTSDLVIPHPRMHKRRFVLQPVCDIDPNVIHPVFNADAKCLLDQLEHYTKDHCVSMRLILVVLLIYLIYQGVKPRAMPPKGGMDGGDDSDNHSSGQLEDEMVKDPYCNVYFPKRTGIHLGFEGKDLYFCSKECRDKFIELNSKHKG